jgi:hypothetical protein
MFHVPLPDHLGKPRQKPFVFETPSAPPIEASEYRLVFSCFLQFLTSLVLPFVLVTIFNFSRTLPARHHLLHRHLMAILLSSNLATVAARS